MCVGFTWSGMTTWFQLLERAVVTLTQAVDLLSVEQLFQFSNVAHTAGCPAYRGITAS